MINKDINSVFKTIKEDIKKNEDYKSSYWHGLLDGINLDNYSKEDKKLNGTFGNISKINFFKSLYHNLFQRILFYKYDYKKDSIFKEMEEICSSSDRNLNLDSLRHVFTHKFLEPIYLKSNKLCVIGDGRLNFSSIILKKYNNISKLYHINLPEVLFFELKLLQKLNLLKIDDVKYITSKEQLYEAETNPEIKYLLFSPNSSNLLLNNNIDLFVNIASFQEINNNIINKYLNIIKSNNAFFYHCNRKFKKLIGGEMFSVNLFDKYINAKVFSGVCPWHNLYYSLKPPFLLKYDGIHIHELFYFGQTKNKKAIDQIKIPFLKTKKFNLFNVFKSLFSKFIFILIYLISFNKKFHQLINHYINEDCKTIKINNSKLKFFNPNQITNYRITNFFNKEPETLKWINSFKDKSIFWDIGANIGSYSLYAAKIKDLKVLAFEPEYNNLELLSKNIRINNLSKQIKIFPIPLSNKNSDVEFKVSDITPGSALSSITDYDQNGLEINKSHYFSTFSMRLDDFCKTFNTPEPDYLKIDIDGAEHLVLEGANDVIENLKSILIETNFNYHEQYINITKILLEKNFILKSKFLFDNTSQFNAIWEKK